MIKHNKNNIKINDNQILTREDESAPWKVEHNFKGLGKDYIFIKRVADKITKTE